MRIFLTTESHYLQERDDSLDAKWCYRTYAYTMPAASRQSPKCTAETSAETTDAEHATDSATTVTREVSEQPRIGSSTPRAASKEPSLSRDPSTIEPDDGTLSRGRANSAENQLVTVRVSLNLFEGGTGCTTWSAGFYLAEFALTNPEIFVGKRVLELGAGAGVLGVVISRLPGVKELILTDGNEETLENLRGNLRLNGVETSTKEPVVARRSNRFSKTGSSILNEQSEVKESSGLRGDKTSSSESAAPSARSDSDGRLKSGRHSVSSGRPDSSWRMEPGESTECCNPDASEGPRFRCEFLDWEDVSEAQLREYDADVM